MNPFPLYHHKRYGNEIRNLTKIIERCKNELISLERTRLENRRHCLPLTDVNYRISVAHLIICRCENRKKIILQRKFKFHNMINPRQIPSKNCDFGSEIRTLKMYLSIWKEGLKQLQENRMTCISFREEIQILEEIKHVSISIQFAERRIKVLSLIMTA